MSFNPLSLDPFGLFSSGDSSVNFPPPPSFVTDPNYQNEQNFLQPYGQGLLTGNNIPSFYQSIATANSPEFQAALGLSNRDIATTAAETAARNGTGRGGQLPQVTAQAVGDNSAQLRYQDYLNSNAGKQFLMQQGTTISQGVRSAGQAQGEDQNNFNLNEYNDTVGQMQYNQSRQDAASAASGKAIGTIAGAAIGSMGGPAGAIYGAQLGSSLASGGNPGTPNASGIANLFNPSPSSSSSNPTADSAGLSSLGAITPSSTTSLTSDDLMKYFNLN